MLGSVSSVPVQPVAVKQLMSWELPASPAVRIVMPFDVVQFNGGLRVAGIPSKKVQGVQHYKVRHYRDLNPLLGTNWH